MSKQILVVRHGETEANVTSTWEGWLDSPLSPRGVSQAKRLAHRLGNVDVAAAITSDLGRARSTAELLGCAAEPDEGLRELGLGDWERMTWDEIRRDYPEDVAAIARGENIAWGGGETMSAVAARVAASFWRFVDSLVDGSVGVIVTHAGSVHALLASLLSIDTSRGWPVGQVVNTSITRFVIDDGYARLAAFNDAEHLDGDHSHGDVSLDSELFLFRHGESVGNVESRWAGRTDSALTDTGFAQAEALAHVAPKLTAMYASPLQRAWNTARPTARRLGLSPIAIDDIQETAFGQWENLTTEEIEQKDPEGWAAFRASVEDIRRGVTGETFAGVRERMTQALDGLVANHPGETIGAVSHGGAIAAYVTGVLGMDMQNRYRLATLDNTGIARVGFHRGVRKLHSYNLTPHLQSRIA